MQRNFFSLVTLYASAVYAADNGECTANCEAQNFVPVPNDALPRWLKTECPDTVIQAELVQTESGEYRTLRAIKDLKEEDLVIAVPRACILVEDIALAEGETAKEVFSTENGKKVPEFDRPDLTLLSLYLLENYKNTENRFHTYFETLPEPDWSHLPSKWTSEELELLQGTDVPVYANRLTARVANDYKLLCEASKAFCATYSLEEFEKSRYMIPTRSFYITDGETVLRAMVPFADQLNHEGIHNMKWHYNAETEQFEVRARSDVKVGEELFTSYGAKANSALLANYGFALSNTAQPNGASFDHVSVNLTNANGDIEKVRMMLMVDQFSTTGEGMDFLRRSLVETEEERKHLEAFDKIEKTDSESRFVFLGTRVEVAMLKSLASQMEDRLKTYPFTVEQIQEKLSSGSLTGNERNALLVAKGEQEICKFWIHTAEEIIPVLTENKGPRLAALLRFFPKKDKNLFKYATWLHNRVSTAQSRQERGLTDVV